MCEKVCGHDLTCDAVSRCAQSVRMKMKPQSIHIDSDSTPTASAPNVPKVVRVHIAKCFALTLM